ncbi:MAG: stp2 [Marmoricola sp.]|nr:stp2 [Marmoricola sp.]
MTNAALTGSPDARRWRALTVSLVGAFMVLLDVSIVNVALPSIEREFGVSAGTAQWVVKGCRGAVTSDPDLGSRRTGLRRSRRGEPGGRICVEERPVRRRDS